MNAEAIPAPAESPRAEAGHRLVLARLRSESPAVSSFESDVREGLSAPRKSLPPKYFYDDLGSRLFSAITALPEYYVARAEAEILLAHSDEIVAELDGPLWLVELGSGDAQKVPPLLGALIRRQHRLRYTPVDVSAGVLEASANRLLHSFPALTVSGWIGDFRDALREIGRTDGESPRQRILLLFLGTTLGNLDPEEQLALTREIGSVLRPGDGFLLGLDLDKPEEVLIPAYDDPLGVTAAFNRNVLGRINRELGGCFDLRSFRHVARYDRRSKRIEMHLESLRAQAVPIGRLGLEVRFEAGETIHTESSYKFDLAGISDLASASGFELRRSWFDGGRHFASSLLVRV